MTTYPGVEPQLSLKACNNNNHNNNNGGGSGGKVPQKQRGPFARVG